MNLSSKCTSETENTRENTASETENTRENTASETENTRKNTASETELIGSVLLFIAVLVLSLLLHYFAVVRIIFILVWICVGIGVVLRIISLKFYIGVVFIVTICLVLFASFITYNCSLMLLNNKDMGTRFKLRTTAKEMLEEHGEYCLRHYSKYLYSMSLCGPTVILQFMQDELEDKNYRTRTKTSHIYLITSLRSVKGKIHSLSMFIRVPLKSAKIKKALDVERNKSMMLAGKILNLGMDLKEIKQNLEKDKQNKLLIRPVVFKVDNVEVKDDDESKK